MNAPRLRWNPLFDGLAPRTPSERHHPDEADMREYQTVRCPICGGVLDVYVEIDTVRVDKKAFTNKSVLIIQWKESVVDHECRKIRFNRGEDDE